MSEGPSSSPRLDFAAIIDVTADEEKSTEDENNISRFDSMYGLDHYF
ncbi:MAG: hypothetical protein QOK64_04445 [Nitrososphaeraceae archaeon]|nr:hypothetical protein [Nitrososphaeraceae archaeon]